MTETTVPCHVCDVESTVEARWPDGWTVTLCRRHAPKSESRDIVVVSLKEVHDDR